MITVLVPSSLWEGAALLPRLLLQPVLARQTCEAGLNTADEFSARKTLSDIAAPYDELLAGKDDK